MSSKKSKKKKHKKEDTISSKHSREDEKEERGTKKLSSTVCKSKHKHHSPVSFSKDKGKEKRTTDLPSSRRLEEKQKKRNVGDSKCKKERSRESKAAENIRPVFKLPQAHEKEHALSKGKHISKSSSSSPAATNQLSSKELEKKRKELVSRRSTSGDHRQTPAKEKLKEKRRKRPSSPQLHAEPKRRNINNVTSVAHTDHHSEVQNEKRKNLVAKTSKKFDPTVDTHSSQGKTVYLNSKGALPVVKPVDSASELKLLENILPKKQDPVQFGNAPVGNLTEKRPSFNTSGISFRIPKKASAIKAGTNADVFNVNSSDIRTNCSAQPPLPGCTPDKHKIFISQQQAQKPPDVPAKTSHKPSPVCSSRSSFEVQKVHTDETRESTILSNASCEEHMELVEELHLARSERRLEGNLVQNCGELTCMDIDPPEEGASTILNHKQALLMVLDTNVLLSHLEYVKKIRSHGLGGLGFPTLLIPWVVLQELDYLKSGKLSSKVEDKARPAVHYIYSCLKNQEPRLMGQSMQQASQTACGPGVVNNDDRVLQCCLQYQALHPEGALVLCTNDKNLCSKALLSGVNALSKADLEKEVDGSRCTILNPHSAVSSLARPVEKVCSAYKAEKDELQDNRQSDAAEEQRLSECVSLLESCLQRALSEVLEEEMKVAFGDLWTEIVYVKPPWSLEGLLTCFKKHWIAVFGNIIKRNLLSSVEMLSDCLCSDRPMVCRSVVSAVGLATELLSALAGRSQYNGHVTSALATLHTLLQRLQCPKDPVEGGDADNEDSLMAEVEEDTCPHHLTSHQEVWELFESIWNNVCQISSALFSALHYTPGTTGSSLQSTSPPPQEALSCLQRLSTALKQLLEALQRLLSADSSVQDAESLLSFIQTSKIAAMEPRFTANDLFDCVSRQEYREKLCVGGAQLSELCVSLDHCAAAVSSWP